MDNALSRPFLCDTERKMLPASEGLVRYSSLTEQIAHSVKQAIFRGELQPGDRLVEQSIARAHGVGQNAVREALISLAHQGFVKRVANRATYVSQLNLEDAQKLSVVRAALEGTACEIVNRRYAEGEVQLDQLDLHLAGMHDAAERLDRVAFYDCDIQFHRELWRLTGNLYLEQMLEQTVAPLFAFFIIQYFRKGDRLETLREAIPAHRQLVADIRSGNPSQAHASLNTLIDVGVKHQQGLVALP